MRSAGEAGGGLVPSHRLPPLATIGRRPVTPHVALHSCLCHPDPANIPDKNHTDSHYERGPSFLLSTGRTNYQIYALKLITAVMHEQRRLAESQSGVFQHTLSLPPALLIKLAP